MEHFTGKVRRAAIVAALASLAPAGAFATPRVEEVPTARVSYADLNLASPRAAATLRMRVEHAARNVCQYSESVRDFSRMAGQRDCMRKALASADIQIAAAVRRTDVGLAFALNERRVRR